MSWHEGPDTRPPGGDAEHDRLPRAIAARLMRAGRLAGAATAAAPLPQEPPRRPHKRWSREVFELIEWRRFEAVVEALFAQAGFETRSQSHGADGGVDIWLHSLNHADGDAPASIVQCKQWMRWKVGVKEVRELRGVMAQHGITRGQFVTTSDFSAEAREFAAGNGIGLHDVDDLLRLIATRTPEQQEALLHVAFAGEWWRPTCASCGIKLVERTARQSGKAFWGCENFARGCSTRMAIRHRLRDAS
ncbi:MAG TPA: restriction endonuclease [Caldimonas sp.]|nr:restriction endonuclease [Caldimonas sp.]HEX4234165.1 restriction endonuclease [Caldimonas sp.]